MAPKYYAVRRGRSVGIFLTWDECSKQVKGYQGNEYKSFTTLKEAEDYLKDTEGTTVIEDKQHIERATKQSARLLSEKRIDDCHSDFTDEQEYPCKKKKLENCTCQKICISSSKSFEDQYKVELQSVKKGARVQGTYFIEFDGASKGNPGPAGAGTVVRYPDGSLFCTLKEGVGVATNNVAEYRGLIRGLKFCLENGIDSVHVQGDSNLVCMQIQDKWKTKNTNIMDLSKEAKELKSKFKEFQIRHVLRAYNTKADELANEAICLPDGQWTCDEVTS